MRILLVKPHPELLVSRRLQEGFLHATLLPKGYASDDIDVAVTGEGGTLFRELIPRINRGGSWLQRSKCFCAWTYSSARRMDTMFPQLARKANR